MNKYFLLVSLTACVSSIKAPPSIGRMDQGFRDEGPAASRTGEEARKAEEERRRREAEEARLRAQGGQGKPGGSRGGPVDTSGQRRTPTDTAGAPKDPVSDAAARDLAAAGAKDTAADFSLPDMPVAPKPVEMAPVTTGKMAQRFRSQKAEIARAQNDIREIIGSGKQKDQRRLTDEIARLDKDMTSYMKTDTRTPLLREIAEEASHINQVVSGKDLDDLEVVQEPSGLKITNYKGEKVIIRRMVSLEFVEPAVLRKIKEKLQEAREEEEGGGVGTSSSRREEEPEDMSVYYKRAGIEVPRAVAYDKVGVSKKLVELKKTPQGQRELLRIANRIRQNREGGLAPLFKKLDTNAENYIMRNLDHLTDQLNSGGIKLQV